MTRTQNIKRNLTFNVIKYIAQIVLQFILRTVLIYVMGVEYLGLNGLFSNIFQFLNLAELGIGSAIVFAMYKPIAENDIEKVKALQNLYKKFYLIIALVVLAVGGILTPFLKIFIKNDVSVDINIYILFIMYLFNAFVGYFSAHKRSLLLAYERNDIENKIKTLCLLGMSIVQIAVLLIFKNYYVYFAINILFTILECIIIHLVANKYYPEINGKSNLLIDAETKKSITKNVAALSLHKIGGAVVFATDNILISSFLGIVVLGAYSNYALIITTLASFYSILSSGLSGSVGNLIASQDPEYVYKKYRQVNFIYSFITAFATICLLSLFQPFIKVWTGGGQYLLEFPTVLILCISFYFDKMRRGTQVFKDAAGLFWQDRWKPIVESVVNLGASIGLAYLMGINGIFLGTIISTLVAPFWWEPYVLYKHYFKKRVWNYFKRYALDLVITVVVAAVCFYTCSIIPDGGIWLLLAKFAVCIILAVGLLCLCYCWTPEFKETFKMVKGMLGRVFKNKNKKTQENHRDSILTEEKDDEIVEFDSAESQNDVETQDKENENLLNSEEKKNED